MEFNNIPKDPIEARWTIKNYNISTIANETIEFIQNVYAHKEILYSCIDFMDYDLIETSRSDLETLSRIWLFPTREASEELNECLHRIISSFYKAAFDNLRRALEIVIVGCYFSQKNIDAIHAREWLNSKRETPLFSRAIKSLLQNERIKKIEQDTLWVTKLKCFYWDLSDVIHVRGEKYSFNSLQPTMFSYNGLNTPYRSVNNLEKTLNMFIQTFQHICTIIAITNPILLIGLPLEEKCGINGPMTGFFCESQAVSLWNLLIPDTKPFFEELIKRDTEVISITDYFNSLPDITDEEFAKQIMDFKKFMSEAKTKET